MTEIVRLDHDGDALSGELTRAGADAPGILIFHSGLGLAAHERGVAQDLARLGYNALAVDMFGVETGGTAEKAGAHFAKLMADPGLVRARAKAWHAEMAKITAGRIAAIGYCFGGMCALELARTGAPISAAVSFHGLLGTTQPAARGGIAGEIMAWCGGADPYATPDQIDAFRAEMAKANARCHVTLFDRVLHSFTNPAADAMNRLGIGYDALADKVSWAGTVALLAHCLKTA